LAIIDIGGTNVVEMHQYEVIYGPAFHIDDVADEKPMTDCLFELADMITYGRLTQAEFSACFG